MNLHPQTAEAYRLLHDGSLAMGRAERHGIRVDVDYVKQAKADLSQQINWTMTGLQETDFYQRWQKSQDKEINLNSPVQLSNYLYNELGLKPPKLTGTEKGSTDEESLLELDLPELNMILAMRKLKKNRDTYLDQFLREQTNGIIHPFFNLQLVTTYRSSSDRPNFQNIPKREEKSMQLVRKAIYPRRGHQLLEIDYGSLEVRVGACYHKDENMLRYIKDPSTDMHRDAMEEIFKLEYNGSKEHAYLRAAAKNGFVFPQFYGDYYVHNAKDMAVKWGELSNGIFKDGTGVGIDDRGTTLGTHLRDSGIKSIKSFETHLEKIEHDFWNNRFPEYAMWRRRMWNIYKRRGFIDYHTGFRCSGVMNKKEVTNYPIQGAAFHCLLWSYIELDKMFQRLNLNTRLLGQIHDAILFDVDPKELVQVAELAREVTTKLLPKAWKWIMVPLEVDAELCPVDGSWAEKEKYKLTA